MGTDRVRVVVLALVSLGLIVASAVAMDWFVIRIPDVADVDRLTFDLRSIRVCKAGVCASVELSQLPLLTRLGLYPTIAPIAFWTSMAFGGLVALQCGARIVTGAAREGWSKFGAFIGTLCLGLAAGTGYVFSPDVAPFTTSRTWAPLILICGYAVAFVALFFAASRESASDFARDRFEPIVAAPADDAAVGAAPPVVSRTRSRPIPPALRGKLKYTTVTAEISRAGLDAHREDGSARLVLWRDVVGAVARRLPPDEPYAGAVFVDLVSSADSTLRLFPWTRFSGEPLDGDGDGEARGRALLALVIARCPDAKLDRATRAFFDGAEPPAQLPDEAMLAQHDERLA